MDCFVPVAPNPAAPAITGSGGSSLAVTGSQLDIAVACAIAAVFLAAGALAVIRARRQGKAKTAASSAPVALVAVLGTVLMLGMFSPTPAAQAATVQECDAITVSNVEIDPASIVDGAIQLLPGANPVAVHASVTNIANAPVSLTAAVETDSSVPLSQHLIWETDGFGTRHKSVLSESSTHPLGDLGPGESASITFAMSLPDELGNEFQGQSFPISLLVDAIQSGN